VRRFMACRHTPAVERQGGSPSVVAPPTILDSGPADLHR